MHTDRNTLTYQDFERAADKKAFITALLSRYKHGRFCQTARTADLYDRQMNATICNYVQMIFNLSGSRLEDFTASNNRIASNFFNRLNTQRVMYSLGNGVSFVGIGESGEDTTKARLGNHFDHDLQDAAYKALIHGVSYCFWNVDRMHVFPATEFAPLWDEETGALRAGVRFWRLDPEHAEQVVLYEIDGYTRFRTVDGNDESLELVKEKTPYIEHVLYTPADGSEEVVGGENYSCLPIVPMFGSRLKQSTLVGLREAIDSYDLIRSGFANDLTDCAQIYWIVSNCGGMDDGDLARFRDRLKLNHIAVVDTDDGGAATPYTQDIPYQARKQYLDDMRSEIYESFGALDVHAVAAGATNDHIDAAYQPMDENAYDFEYQIGEAIKQVLALMGIEDTPVFQRSRISNQLEQVQMVMQEANYLDDETVLRKLPNITPDEVQAVLQRRDVADLGRMTAGMAPTAEEVENGEEEEE